MLLSNSKIEEVHKLLMYYPSDWKIVICSEFTSSITMLRMHLVATSTLVAKTQTQAYSVIKRFREDVNQRVLLCTRGTCGSGLDLGFVDVLILLEPPFNCYHGKQLVGRLSRIGQRPLHTATQQVVHLIYTQSCEEHLYTMHCAPSTPLALQKTRSPPPPPPVPRDKRGVGRPRLTREQRISEMYVALAILQRKERESTCR
jgi:SNF2 family DNA or RNA helicase